MKCPKCTTDNPATNAFCGECGASFGINAQSIEYEITEKIVARFMTLLKIAAWVFAPAIFVLGVAISVVAFLGFHTYTDATAAIKNASAAAVKDVQGSAASAKADIGNVSRTTQATIDSYAKSPALSNALRNVQSQANIANQKISSIMKSAQENQDKLTEIAAARQVNPSLPLGSLSGTAVVPSLPGGTFFSATPSLSGGSLSTAINTPVALNIGSKCDDVKSVQSSLKAVKCYDGEITGEYDQATADAVKAFRAAQTGLTSLGINTMDGGISSWERSTMFTFGRTCK